MCVSVVRRERARDGRGYQVTFPQGDAFLTDSTDGKSVEVVWLGVDASYQGQGVAEFVMRRLRTHFREKPIVPINVLPEAEAFWRKMARRGYCRLDRPAIPTRQVC